MLDAIDEAGIRDNTIVIWLSDNGATVTGTVPEEVGGGSNGPFKGELGDAYEGSLRTAGMIRWPGKIEPSVTNEMISVHDFLPTLAGFMGAEGAGKTGRTTAWTRAISCSASRRSPIASTC